jgi:predicted nucleic acid-binding Zn ribbon protein
MPTYEYQCEANGRTVEVQHKMAERLTSWAELCRAAGIAAGTTDPAAPVRKLICAGFVHAGGAAGAAREPFCDTGGCGAQACGAGGCGLQ